MTFHRTDIEATALRELLVEDLRRMVKLGTKTSDGDVKELLLLPRVEHRAKGKPDRVASLRGELHDVIARLWSDRGTRNECRKAARVLLVTPSFGEGAGKRRAHAAGLLDCSEKTVTEVRERELLHDIACELLDPHADPPLVIPPAKRLYGRNDSLAELVESVRHAACDDSDAKNGAKVICVLGPAGVGKTELAGSCLHDREVVELFDQRRYYVECTYVRGRQELLFKLASLLNVVASETAVRGALGPKALAPKGLERHVVRGAMLVLDGVEKPLQIAPEEACTAQGQATPADEFKQLIHELSGVPRLALVCTHRGGVAPTQLAKRIVLDELPLDAAREMFNALTHAKFEGDPDLDSMLGELHGLPLALTLKAPMAEAEHSTLASALEGELWPPGGLLAKIYEDSINALDANAQRLLKMIAPLPAGVDNNADALRALLADDSAYKASNALCEAALAKREGRPARLRVHELIREHVVRNRVPSDEDLKRVVAHYCKIAIEHGPKVGHTVADTKRMIAEGANVYWATRKALQLGDPCAVDATLALRGYAWLAGVTITPLAQKALSLATDEEKADLFNEIGLNQLARSDHESAQNSFSEALERAGDDKQLNATSFLCLAEVSLRRFDSLRRFEDETADALFNTALDLYTYTALADPVGQAHCELGLGQLALRGGALDTARGHFEVAAEGYDDRDRLGEINCSKGFADIAWRGGYHDAAREGFAAALKGYEDLGYVLGCANCVRDLAEIDLACGRPEDARKGISDALAMYERVDNKLGRANCLAAQAQLASVSTEAQDLLERAKGLYDELGCTTGGENCRTQLADLAMPAAGGAAARTSPRREWIPDDNG